MSNRKTALVTGSTSGIGLGIATSLAASGANVILNGFGDAAEIERLRAKLAAAHAVEVRYDSADLRSRTQSNG
jgi:3-hydroxybutyrate dehydrogenase